MFKEKTYFHISFLLATILSVDMFALPADKSSSGKTPIPTKATLARSASSKRKVPPIPLSEWSHPDDTQSHDSSRDSVLDDPNLEEDDRQVSVTCHRGHIMCHSGQSRSRHVSQRSRHVSQRSRHVSQRSRHVS